MAQHRHLFVIDPLENLNMKLDSSLRLAKALLECQQECYITTPNDITWLHRTPSSMPFCQATQLHLGDGSIPTPSGKMSLDLTEFRSIHMRKDPPYDMNYISCTWLLAVAEAKGVTIYNSTEALRALNEKLAIFNFPQFCRPGATSSSSQELLSFAKTLGGGDVIIKPLNLFGGRGVRRMTLADLGEEEFLKQLKAETANDTQLRIIQAFDPAIFDGELRVFSCCQEILSWCLKKPHEGEYLANTSRGATLHAYTPKKEEIDMIQEVSDELAKKGVKLVGFDIIGGYISEINITSPRLLLPDDVDTAPIYQAMAHSLLKDLANHSGVPA